MTMEFISNFAKFEVYEDNCSIINGIQEDIIYLEVLIDESRIDISVLRKNLFDLDEKLSNMHENHAYYKSIMSSYEQICFLREGLLENMNAIVTYDDQIRIAKQKKKELKKQIRKLSRNQHPILYSNEMRIDYSLRAQKYKDKIKNEMQKTQIETKCKKK